MTKETIFQIWAPDGSPWSRWVKPVLFAWMDPAPSSLAPAPTWDASWASPATGDTALVVDLPGGESVAAGLALAERGYRPVPLYNAVPMPTAGFKPPDATAVDVWSIVSGLWQATPRLQERSLPFEAPPVFLLDWGRAGGGVPPGPGSFDNRSVSFTTDFPSANFLLAHGVQRVVVVQSSLDQPQPDLAHTLRRWQEAGMVIELKRLDAAGGPMPCDVPKPSWFGWAFQRVLVALGLRRYGAGGFGGWVPQPSSG